MFEEIPNPGFGLNFDPSHFVWQQMDYLKAMREFAPRFHHVHLKDARIDRHRLDEVGIMAYPLQFHTPKLPGLGDVDWGAVLLHAQRRGLPGPVCVEVEDRAYEGSLELRKASLRAELHLPAAVCRRREVSTRGCSAAPQNSSAKWGSSLSCGGLSARLRSGGLRGRRRLRACPTKIVAARGETRTYVQMRDTTSAWPYRQFWMVTME